VGSYLPFDCYATTALFASGSKKAYRHRRRGAARGGCGEPIVLTAIGCDCGDLLARTHRKTNRGLTSIDTGGSLYAYPLDRWHRAARAPRRCMRRYRSHLQTAKLAEVASEVLQKRMTAGAGRRRPRRQTDLRRAYGMADLEQGVHAAGMSSRSLDHEQFTASPSLQLVNSGRSTGRRDHEVPAGLPTQGKDHHRESVTHTSGIQDMTECELSVDDAEDATPEGLIDRFKNEPMASTRAKWRYDNSGYVILGAIVERVGSRTATISQRGLSPPPDSPTRTRRPGDNHPKAGSRYEQEVRPHVNADISACNAPVCGRALVSTVDDLARWTAPSPQAAVSGSCSGPTRQKLNDGRPPVYGYGWTGRQCLRYPGHPARRQHQRLRLRRALDAGQESSSPF